jgi:hypothetical protein
MARAAAMAATGEMAAVKFALEACMEEGEAALVATAQIAIQALRMEGPAELAGKTRQLHKIPEVVVVAAQAAVTKTLAAACMRGTAAAAAAAAQACMALGQTGLAAP